MYCPECRVEYRPGFTQCSDCEVELVSELPPEPPAPADWVPVFESSDPLIVSLAKAALEDAGIPFLDNSGETGARLIVGAVFPSCWFLVPPEYELDARALLEDLMREGEGQVADDADDL